uniref:glycosyltransferase family 2 protein n=1 Tax=Haladaptatus sp. DJG-WS-42 TaxID=3120516 RepID=UPI00403EFC4E
MNEPSVSIIVPTLNNDPLTLQSVPSNVEVCVVTEGNRAEARNIGASRTNGKILVFCDDDIRFSENFFWEQVLNLEERTICGLLDFDFNLLLTRFFVVHRDAFEKLGGFDERLNHMEDTEFCLNALTNGYNLQSIPRDSVYHKEHESRGQGRWTTLKSILYLSARYPKFALRLFKGIIKET